jgi:tetratricopeptide (TPR) repeat protein
VFPLGFPELTYRFARMRLATGDVLVGRMLLANAWLGVDDPARIELPIDPHPALRLESFIARGHEAGVYMLAGDLAAAERIMRDLADQITDEDGPERGVAFLLTLQGRFAEAADMFDELPDLPDHLRDVGPPGVTLRQGLTAKLYVYRQLGRADRARAVLDYYKEHVLPMRRAETLDNAFLTEIAGVEAVEGRRTEAIAALRSAMKVSELPPNFMPQLPWFASLESTPGYAELLRERERRIEKLKAEFAKIDAEFKVPAG